MSRVLGPKGAALLAFAAVLGGCTNREDWSAADAGSGGMFRAAWGGMRSDGGEPSDTMRRLRGVETAQQPLQVEPGNVWPAEEAPRATLANPDAALRGVPAYRPGDTNDSGRFRDGTSDGRQDAGPRADVAPDDQRPPPRRRRGASSPPPPPLEQPEPNRVEVLPVPPGGNAPPRRYEGQVIIPPSGGGPIVTGGGTPNIQSFTTPGGGGGVIHNDGGVTTISPSGGPPQTFINRR